MTAFQEIYQEYGKPVYRFLLKLSDDEGQAEELLQETFYQALVHADRFEGRCSVYTWLCQIGKNAWLKECRRKKRFDSRPVEEIDLEARGPTPEERVLLQDGHHRARRAVSRLEEPYKDVFILHVFGGLSLKEIGAGCGKSESWARVTYYRARQKIMEEADL